MNNANVASAIVFNIQRYSIHDGPGIRTTIFMKGCPLDCWWCHNPESRDRKAAIFMFADRCIGCETCLKVCPEDVAEPLDWNPAGLADPLKCTLCGTCADQCPTDARTIVGNAYDVDALMREIDKDQVFYDESGGGVTFSGGDPLGSRQNAAFLISCLQACGERGYHRAVDTAGFTTSQTIQAVAPLTDLFLYDLKLLDDERHRKYVGVSNQTILDNLRVLSDLDANIWIRVPLIPGINDDQANMEATADFVASLDRPSYPVYLLPYHRIGSDKHRHFKEGYRLKDLDPPSKEQIVRAAEPFLARNLKVIDGNGDE
ncbi:Benzylsuccinate synthase activating enzyme [Planctomycetes bacterium CA13]|uniref:Benzylsuccinate synthase activating enzyme n=1 Tax=Novipirellula herctigrandis TaxID=2527986 RepID=A0A5C5YN36_9BACT|nr:Benzylsuccinate synthase activating enzyme [Planctomycetes bacterium CA13]